MIGKVVREVVGIDGRIGRLQFWLGILILFGLLLVTFAFLVRPVPVLAIAAIFLGPLTVLILCIRRLHDRNKSGWWVLLLVVFPNVVDNYRDELTEGTALWWVAIAAAIAVGLWGLIEIGFLRGTAGDNDYGPDPLTKSSYHPAPSDEVESTPVPDA